MKKIIKCLLFSFLVIGFFGSSCSNDGNESSSSSEPKYESITQIPTNNKYSYFYKDKDGDFCFKQANNSINLSKKYSAYFEALSYGYDSHTISRYLPFVKDNKAFFVFFCKLANESHGDYLLTYYDLAKNRIRLYATVTHESLIEKAGDNYDFEFEQSYHDVSNIDYKISVIDSQSKTINYFEIIIDITSFDIKYFDTLVETEDDYDKACFAYTGCFIEYNAEDYPVLKFADKEIIINHNYLKNNAEHSYVSIKDSLLSVRAMWFGNNIFVRVTPSSSEDIDSRFTTIFLFDKQTNKLEYLNYSSNSLILSIIEL